MKTIKKIGLVGAVAFALFAFNACGDDSGSTSASGENGSSHMSSSTPIEDLDESSSSGKVPESAEGTGGVSSSVAPNGCERSSSSSRKTSANSESSSSVVVSSSSSFPVVDCEREGAILSMADGTSFICKDGFLVPYSSSSKITLSSSSSKYPVMDSVFNEQVNYGKYQDPRDGQEYKTITVTLYAGTSYEETFELFAQNLNYGKWVKSTDNVADEDTVKYCYDDDEWYCENYFGGLYSWAEAMGFPEACNSAALGSEKCPYEIEETRGSYHWAIHQGICPDGWHIQNIQEFSGTGYGSLSNIYYPNTGRWSQDNPSGRSFLLAGAFYEDGYGNLGKFTYFALPDPRVSSFVEEEEKDTRVSSYVIGINPVAYDGHIRQSYYKAGYAVEDASSKKKKVSVRCARIITRE
ncbi:MAG: hypothetical protein MJZ85_06315 [Bacteroidales bacterium]|nr:hypothetical protein [Bacteroidales bacterium]